MKNFLKKIIGVPFAISHRIKVNKESLLWVYANDKLNDPEKLRLGKKALFTLISHRSAPKGFKIISYLNALNDHSELADRFAENMIDQLPFLESQLGQDCMVDTILNKKNNGLFIEIGVGDGKHISNTYFLEKYRNWTGVLCEPSIKFHDNIVQQRSAQLVKKAVFDRSGLELKFSEVDGNEELSTLTEFKKSDTHDRSKDKEYPVQTISFNDLCKEYLPGKKIDYLSIDTEGSELQILSAIDFSAIDISIISVEHNYEKSKLEALTTLLNKWDYTELLPGVFEFDAIFAKNKNGRSLT